MHRTHELDLTLSFLGFFHCSRSSSLVLATQPSLDINVALLSPGLVWILVIPDSKYKKHHMPLRKDLGSGVQSRGPHWFYLCCLFPHLLESPFNDSALCNWCFILVLYSLWNMIQWKVYTLWAPVSIKSQVSLDEVRWAADSLEYQIFGPPLHPVSSSPSDKISLIFSPTYSFQNYLWVVPSCFFSVAQSCLTLCAPMDCRIAGFPVFQQIPEFAQTHVHQVGDSIQPSHPLSSASSLAFKLS